MVVVNEVRVGHAPAVKACTARTVGCGAGVQDGVALKPNFDERGAARVNVGSHYLICALRCVRPQLLAQLAGRLAGKALHVQLRRQRPCEARKVEQKKAFDRGDQVCDEANLPQVLLLGKMRPW